MSLIDLGTDVLLHIFALFDVYTILSLSRVSRLFHDISSTKQLWISIVHDLSARRLIDIPLDEIGALSKDALVKEVRRVVAGPQTWSSNCPFPPTVLRHKTIDLGGHGCAHLLPGGTHIVFSHDGIAGNVLSRTIECFEVRSGRRLCAWSSPRPGLFLSRATVDFAGGASRMMVTLSFFTPSVDEDELLFLDVDLNTGQSRDILHVSFPDAFLWGGLQLSGDFFICYAGQTEGSWHVLILNWRTESFVLLDRNGDDQTTVSFAILPGHLVLVHSASEPYTHTIHLHSLAIFDHLWRPLSEFSLSDSIDPTGLVFVQLSVPDNVRQQSFLTLSVAESPRHDDTWELLIQVRDYVPPAPRPRLGSLLQRFGIRAKRSPKSIPPVTVSRFLVTLPRGQSSPSALPQITLTTVFRHSKDFWYTSSAGYGLYSEPGAEIRYFIQQLNEAEARSPRSLNLYSPMRVQLTQSGTVLVTDGPRTVLLYYM